LSKGGGSDLWSEPGGFLHRKPPFFKRADNIRPYGDCDDINRFTVGRGLAPAVKTAPLSKGGFLLRIPPRQSAFPEGKVDFLQLVEEKTEEGLQVTRRAASLVQREVSPKVTEGL